MSALRGLPRVFVPGADPEATIALPKEEVDKLRRVLRLSAGAEIAILPNDGSVLRCRFTGREAESLERFWPQTEPIRRLSVCQALPKGDKLDEIVRACTEIGVAHFAFFESDRTVVKWDREKLDSRLSRLATIAREACEIAFRTKLPTFEVLGDLGDVLRKYPEAAVLSEAEGEAARLKPDTQQIVVGPEGGWSPREIALIGSRGVTLGPRVLRVDHAAPAAAALLLLV